MIIEQATHIYKAWFRSVIYIFHSHRKITTQLDSNTTSMVPDAPIILLTPVFIYLFYFLGHPPHGLANRFMSKSVINNLKVLSHIIHPVIENDLCFLLLHYISFKLCIPTIIIIIF